MKTLLAASALALTSLVLAASPASAAENFTYDGQDVAWTDGPRVIAVQDKECDHNDAAVRFRIGSESLVRTLRDTDGCSGAGIARTFPSSSPRITSMHVCEYVGATQEIAHCTPWKDI